MDLLNPKTHLPWVTFEAKRWLDSYLRNTMTVFEWGSGGSTLYFAKQVRQVISVEHDQKWYDAVISSLKHEKFVNYDYFLIPPRKYLLAPFLPYNSHTYVSRTFEAHKKLHFKEYVRKIDDYANESFDLVVVDGRSRIACMAHALKKIKKGGFLMLDNSERTPYQSAMKKLAGLIHKDFFGKGPYCTEEWQTTIWQIQ